MYAPQARIGTLCTACSADVELGTHQLWIVKFTKHDELQRSEYSFNCPTCSSRITHPADSDVVDALEAVSVPVEYVEIPAEALELHDGAPLTTDDLLDLYLELMKH